MTDTQKDILNTAAHIHAAIIAKGVVTAGQDAARYTSWSVDVAIKLAEQVEKKVK